MGHHASTRSTAARMGPGVRAYSWNMPASEAAAAAAAARVEYPVVDTASRKSIGWRTKLMIRSSTSLFTSRRSHQLELLAKRAQKVDVGLHVHRPGAHHDAVPGGSGTARDGNRWGGSSIHVHADDRPRQAPPGLRSGSASCAVPIRPPRSDPHPLKNPTRQRPGTSATREPAECRGRRDAEPDSALPAGEAGGGPRWQPLERWTQESGQPTWTTGRRWGSGSASRRTSWVTGAISPTPKNRYRSRCMIGLPSVQSK